MKELKIKIWNIENVVLMKILEQDECLRGKGTFYEASNNYEIESVCCPSLFTECIYIKGTDERFDNKVCCKEFDTVQKAEEYIRKVKEAVAEYNNTLREVLNKKEKEYLRGVINPFRENVEYVCKKDWIMTDKQYIGIKVNEEYIELPGFKKGTMYKGMEADRRYTLEELKLKGGK